MTTAKVKITGLKKLLKNFDLTDRDMKTLARTATHTVARIVTKRAKRKAPKDEGVLRKAIKTKRRKPRSGMFRSDTIVNVAPDAKGAWYWHFIERGTVTQSARPFIAPALRLTKPEAMAIFKKDILGRAIKRMNRRGKK